MTIAEYLREVQSAIRCNPAWRSGQAYFNTLYQFRPDLSEKIRGTRLDPFHGVPSDDFFGFLLANWS